MYSRRSYSSVPYSDVRQSAAAPIAQPFSQTDWPTPKQITTAPAPTFYNLALLAAVVVSAPFFNSTQATAKSASPAAPDQVYINVPLLDYQSRPFVQSDWSSPARVRLSAPDQLHTNIGRFTNPIPFGPYDYQKAAFLPREPQPPQGMARFNPNLYKNNIPFGPFDWSEAARQRPQPDHPPYNLALLGTQVVAIPFLLDDFGKTFVPTSAPPQLLPRNPNLFSEVPFSQDDWTTSKPIPRFAAPDRPYNVLIYSEVPFGQSDWSKGQPLDTSPAWLPAYNPNLYGIVTPPPFVAIDWSKPFAIRSLPPAPAALNINLFTNPLPFAQLDWSKPITVASVPGAPLPLNLSLSIVVQNPFSQTDWSVTVRSKTAAVDQVARNVLILSEVPFFQTDWPKAFYIVGLPPGSGPLNVNLFSNPIPFAQYDWSKPQQSPNWQGAKSSDFNLSLASAPVAPPFVQLDWSKPVNVAPVRPDQLPPNTALLVTPPPPSPFYQLDWSKPYQVVGLPPVPFIQAPFNINLYPGEPHPPDVGTVGGSKRRPGGQGISRKKWEELLEEEARERAKILAEHKRELDAKAKIKVEAEERRVAKVLGKISRQNDEKAETERLRLEAEARAEAEFKAALLAEIERAEEDEDEILMMLLSL